MIRRVLAVALVGLLTGLCRSQAALFYRFTAGEGPTAINYGAQPSGTSLTPWEGTLQGAKEWSQGKFGSGLAGGTAQKPNWCDTGFLGPIQGSCTFAWFMKRRTAPPATETHFFSGFQSLRCFTGGAAGTGLRVAGWGGPDLDLKVDIQSAANGAWVHVMLVIDATNNLATFYVDGKAQPATTITGGANVPADTNGFRIGMHTTSSSGSTHDIDEFRFVNGVPTAAEIALWPTAPVAGQGRYGRSCSLSPVPGLFLRRGGRPVVGTKTYQVQWSVNHGSCWAQVLSIGVSRTRLFNVPILPLDLAILHSNLNGCPWESSMEILIPTSICNGSYTYTFNIPPLAGATLYLQALGQDTRTWYSSNGFVMAIEQQ